MPLVALPHRALIAITGEDAEHLLDGLVTSQLPALGEALGSALLAPQGKIFFTFLMSRTDGGFLLECDAGERDALVKRLALYKLRAKVDIAAVDTPVFARFSEPGEAGEVVDRRHGDMGTRIYGAADADTPLGAYQNHRAHLAVLEGPDEIISGQDFPHDVALDLIGAVSFSKGCFVGQEVVSRVKHRGTARRRPVLIEGDGTPAGWKAGDEVLAGERTIGSIRLVGEGVAVAVVRIDQVKDALSVDSAPITLTPPAYATYALGPAPANAASE